eukprot:gene1237-biopygen15306
MPARARSPSPCWPPCASYTQLRAHAGGPGGRKRQRTHAGYAPGARSARLRCAGHLMPQRGVPVAVAGFPAMEVQLSTVRWGDYDFDGVDRKITSLSNRFSRRREPRARSVSAVFPRKHSLTRPKGGRGAALPHRDPLGLGRRRRTTPNIPRGLEAWAAALGPPITRTPGITGSAVSPALSSQRFWRAGRGTGCMGEQAEFFILSGNLVPNERLDQKPFGSKK